MSIHGNPALDIILVNDAVHRTMLERGSNRLLSAIVAQREGREPKPRGEMIWLNPYLGGEKHRPAATMPMANLQQRDPCIGCGVRADQHRMHGCSSYRRGMAA